MDRFFLFLPSILILGLIVTAMRLYFKLVLAHFGPSFKSVEWQKNNRWKCVWAYGTPLEYLWAPSIEELIFRAPLIVAFSSPSEAGVWIYISAATFGLVHWRGTKVTIDEIFKARERGEHQSDDVIAEEARLYAESGNETLWAKVRHVLFTTVLGYLAGYYGLKYQSLWVAFGVHALWNIVVPFAIAIIALAVMFIMYAGFLVWEKIAYTWDDMTWRWRVRRSARRQSQRI